MAQKKPRILCVDEDAEDGFTLTTLLRLASYEPVTTSYASDALQFAQTDDFDLYILSRHIPAGSGESLCQKLHAIAPKTPIVFLSDGSEDRAANCRDVLEAAGRVLATGHNTTAALRTPLR